MISTLTINTAIDKLLFIDAWSKNNTNRIKKTAEVLGGKGTHVAINLSNLGVDSRCFGVIRGEVGLRIKSILGARANIDVKMLYYNEGNSRSNYAIIEDDRTCTLVAEKGEMVEGDICRELVETISANTCAGDHIVLSGDASNTEIPFIYNVIMDRLRDRNVKVFLDTSSQNLIEGIKGKPFLVKPNVDELSQVVGRPVTSEAGIRSAMDAILSKGIEVVAVSCGGDGSFVASKDIAYRVYPLAVDVRNTIGCGDAYLTGLVYGFSKGMSMEETLLIATAVSAATAESELTVGFDVNRAWDMVSKVRLKRL